MTTTVLKLIALILMLIDHIGQFIPETPIWFGWIGRISAPLFMFCVIWGFTYTSDKRKYLTRLYLFGVFVAILNLIITAMYIGTYHYLTNNFITTLFLVGIILFIIYKNERKYYIGFGIWQLVSTLLCVFLVEFAFYSLINPYTMYMFFGSLFGNIIYTEGGFLFVALGILIYLTRNNRLIFIIGYGGFSILTYLLIRRYGYHLGFVTDYLLPFANYQWMMVAALPFMLLYNRKKGAGLKYFFYIFYPLHIIILFIIGTFLTEGP